MRRNEERPGDLSQRRMRRNRFRSTTQRLALSGSQFDGLSLFASTADVGGETELVHDAAHLSEVVSFIQHSPWGCSGLGAGRDIGRLGPVHRRPTTPWASVNRLRLTPRLPRSVGLAPVFPRPGAIWSWRRPCSSRPFSSRVPVPPATAPETPQRQPIPSALDPEQMPVASNSRRTSGTRGRPPPNDGCSHARGSGAPALPTARRRSGTRRWWDWFWWLGQHASYEAAWGLSLWSLPQSSRNPNFASPNG